MTPRHKTKTPWAITALAAASLAAAGVATPRPAAAQNVGVQTAGDLMKLCGDPSDSAKIACKFFVLGALQSATLMHAADAHDAKAMLYCASDSVTNGDLIVAIRGLVSAHPERLNFPAASVVVGGAMEAYPCKREPTETVHHSPIRRTTKPK